MNVLPGNPGTFPLFRQMEKVLTLTKDGSWSFLSVRLLSTAAAEAVGFTRGFTTVLTILVRRLAVCVGVVGGWAFQLLLGKVVRLNRQGEIEDVATGYRCRRV